MEIGVPAEPALVAQAAPLGLFHYTNLAGFLGILREGVMWASDIGFVNDASELVYFFDMVIRVLEETKKRSPKRDAEAFDVLWTMAGSLQAADLRHYCFSLSENPDLLSQWRGYAPDGDGVSISFRLPELLKRADEQRFVLRRCNYSPRAQKALVRDFLGASIKLLRLTDVKEDSPATWEVAVDFGTELTRLAAVMKNPLFEEEREWRVVSDPDGDFLPTKYRVSKGRLIPYYAFRLTSDDEPDVLPIDCVYVGPSAYQELTCKAIRRALSDLSVAPFAVKKSAIPFR